MRIPLYPPLAKGDEGGFDLVGISPSPVPFRHAKGKNVYSVIL
jgi:hypothetical protein